MSSDPNDRILLLYELAAAAGGNRHPPVSPEHAKLVAETVPADSLALVERLYRAVEQAVETGEPDETLESVLDRAREILGRPN